MKTTFVFYSWRDCGLTRMVEEWFQQYQVVLTTLTIDVDGIGDYSLRVTDVNGCSNFWYYNSLLIQ